MKILLNQNPIKKFPIIKDKFIIIGFNENKSIAEIAENIGISRQALHLRFIALCDVIENIEPKIKDIYDSFDTYLNLNLVADVFWRKFIAKLVVFRNKDIFISNIKENHLCDIKLYHHAIYVKKGNYTSVVSSFLKPIKNELPISVIKFASDLELNDAKLEEFLENLFHDKVYIIDRYILSTQRGSLFKALKLYCNSEEINYQGNLKELYNKFDSKYKFIFERFNIKNYEDFITYIKKQMQTFVECVSRRKGTKEYELTKFLLEESRPSRKVNI